jgi:hypothetical protein
MKLTPTQKIDLLRLRRLQDYELLHAAIDGLMEERLKELDMEFMLDLREVSKDVEFGYLPAKQ